MIKKILRWTYRSLAYVAMLGSTTMIVLGVDRYIEDGTGNAMLVAIVGSIALLFSSVAAIISFIWNNLIGPEDDDDFGVNLNELEKLEEDRMRNEDS